MQEQQNDNKLNIISIILPGKIRDNKSQEIEIAFAKYENIENKLNVICNDQAELNRQLFNDKIIKIMNGQTELNLKLENGKYAFFIVRDNKIVSKDENEKPIKLGVRYPTTEEVSVVFTAVKEIPNHPYIIPIAPFYKPIEVTHKDTTEKKPFVPYGMKRRAATLLSFPQINPEVDSPAVNSITPESMGKIVSVRTQEQNSSNSQQGAQPETSSVVNDNTDSPNDERNAAPAGTTSGSDTQEQNQISDAPNHVVEFTTIPGPHTRTNSNASEKPNIDEVENTYSFYTYINKLNDDNVSQILQNEIRKLIESKFESNDLVDYLKSLNINKCNLSEKEYLDEQIKSINKDNLKEYFINPKNDTYWKKFKRFFSRKDRIFRENLRDPEKFANCKAVLDHLFTVIRITAQGTGYAPFRSGFGEVKKNWRNSRKLGPTFLIQMPKNADKIFEIILKSRDYEITVEQAVNDIYRIFSERAAITKEDSTPETQRFYENGKAWLEQSTAAYSARIFGKAIKDRYKVVEAYATTEIKNNLVEAFNNEILGIKKKEVSSDTLSKLEVWENKDNKKVNKKDGMISLNSVNEIKGHFQNIVNTKVGFFHYRSHENKIRYQNFSEWDKAFKAKQILNSLYELISETCFTEGMVTHGFNGGTTIYLDKIVRNHEGKVEILGEEKVTVASHAAQMLDVIDEGFENKITYVDAVKEVYKILEKISSATYEKDFDQPQIKEVQAKKPIARKPSRRDNETQVLYDGCKILVEELGQDILNTASKDISVGQSTFNMKS